MTQGEGGKDENKPHGGSSRVRGSWLIQGGTETAGLTRILRHADVRVTAKVCAHLRTEDLESALEALARRATGT
jgi:hypothetical protein